MKGVLKQFIPVVLNNNENKITILNKCVIRTGYQFQLIKPNQNM
jgi:hypothetical protein